MVAPKSVELRQQPGRTRKRKLPAEPVGDDCDDEEVPEPYYYDPDYIDEDYEKQKAAEDLEEFVDLAVPIIKRKTHIRRIKPDDIDSYIKVLHENGRIRPEDACTLLPFYKNGVDVFEEVACPVKSASEQTQTAPDENTNCETIENIDSKNIVKKKKKKAPRRRQTFGEYYCNFCDYKHRDFVAMSVHFKSKHTDKVIYTSFLCPKKGCGRPFKHVQHLSFHIRTIHMKELPYQCPLCNKQFVCIEGCRIHMRTHSGNKPFACSYCGKCFSSKYSARTHQVTHDKSRPFMCPNEQCSESFKLKQAYEVHYRQVHMGHRPFLCEVCDFGFGSSSNLKAHKRRNVCSAPEVRIKGRGPFVCEVCGFGFRSSSSLKAHMRRNVCSVSVVNESARLDEYIVQGALERNPPSVGNILPEGSVRVLKSKRKRYTDADIPVDKPQLDPDFSDHHSDLSDDNEDSVADLAVETGGDVMPSESPLEADVMDEDDDDLLLSESAGIPKDLEPPPEMSSAMMEVCQSPSLHGSSDLTGNAAVLTDIVPPALVKKLKKTTISESAGPSNKKIPNVKARKKVVNVEKTVVQEEACHWRKTKQRLVDYSFHERILRLKSRIIPAPKLKTKRIIEEPDSIDWSIHDETDEVSNIFECHECSRVFPSKSDRDMHAYEDHVKKLPILVRKPQVKVMGHDQSRRKKNRVTLSLQPSSFNSGMKKEKLVKKGDDNNVTVTVRRGDNVIIRQEPKGECEFVDIVGYANTLDMEEPACVVPTPPKRRQSSTFVSMDKSVSFVVDDDDDLMIYLNEDF